MQQDQHNDVKDFVVDTENDMRDIAELGPTALELRRRIFERRHASSLEALVSKSHDAARLMSRRVALVSTCERVLGKDKLETSTWEASHRLMCTQSCQQLEVRQSIDRLRSKKDLAHSAVESLAHLEKKVASLRSRARGEGIPGAETEVSKMHKSRRNTLRSSAAPLLEDGNEGSLIQAVQCRCCGAFVKDAQHENECRRDSRRKNFEARVSKVATRPRPPRNARIGTVESASIEVLWEPPILDGGSQIVDYEISIDGGMPRCTSSFCLKEPVFDFGGYVFDGLRGDREYSGIRVRCKNDKGWSDFSNSVEARTKECVASTPPLFLMATETTNDAFGLYWQPPFFDGGADIVEYRMTYTEVRHLSDTEYIAEFGGKARNNKPVRTDFHVSTKNCSLVLKNLRGSTDYECFRLRAINEAGLESKETNSSGLKVTTKPPTHRQRLQAELTRVKKVESPFVDTEFYGGYVQRENRIDYTERLEEDLKGIDAVEREVELPDFISRLDLSKTSEEGEAPEQTDESAKEAERRTIPDRPLARQFEFRIAQLKKDMESSETLRWRCFADRAALTRKMAASQKRLLLVRAEIDRVAPVKATYINSSVIHGSDQRFTKQQLQHDLQNELAECLGDIAQAKRDVRHLDVTRENAAKTVIRKQNELDDRKAAYSHYKTKLKKAHQVLIKRADKGIDARVFFTRWREFRDARRSIRSRILVALTSALERRLRNAVEVWRFGRRFEANSGDAVSLGSKLLAEAGTQRAKTEAEALECLNFLGEVSKSVSKLAYSTKQLETWRRTKRPAFEAAWTMLQTNELIEGDVFFRTGKYDQAIEAYQRSTNTTSVKLLAQAFAGLGMAYLKRKEHAKALVALDRSLSLIDELEVAVTTLGSTTLSSKYISRKRINEAKRVLEESSIPDDHDLAVAALAVLRGRSNLGSGEALLELAEYEEATLRLERAKGLWHVVGDALNVGEAERLLREVRDRTRTFSSQDNKEEELVDDGMRRLRKGMSRLAAINTKLKKVSAKQGPVVELVRESARALKLREEKLHLLRSIEELREEGVEHKKGTTKVAQLVDLLEKELKVAKTTEKDEMSSALVHAGREQVFDIEELKMRLTERLVEAQRDLEESQQAERGVEIKISNALDTIQDHEKELQVETGDLMTSVTKKKAMFRHVALNAANVACNDVKGNVSGGVSQMCASSDHSISLFEIATGKLIRIFPQGSLISALSFFGDKIYSGGMDMVVYLWHTSTAIPKLVLRGHEATVTSVTSDGIKIVSGAADTMVRIWDAQSGACLKVLSGHSKSILALQCGPSWMISGGADGQARLWGISEEKYVCRRTLKTQSTGLTAAQYGSLELIGGLQDGSIVAWWLASGEIVQRCKPHARGPVHSLQFDATRVVSSGGDGLVVVTDLCAGEPLHSLRGHSGPVLAVAFDTGTILSVGVDNTLREWYWGGNDTRDKNKSIDDNQYHVFDAKDSVESVAKRYDVKIADLVRWNAIADVRTLRVGTRLMVYKADASKLATAEQSSLRAAEKKKQRRQEAVERREALQDAAKRITIVKEKTRPKKVLKSLYHVNAKSIAGRFAMSTDQTTMDLDRALDRHCRMLNATTNRELRHRLNRAIEYSSIDSPSIEFTAARREVSQSEKEQRSEAPDDGAVVDKDVSEKQKTLLETSSSSVLDFVLSAVLDDETEAMAREELRSRTWDESLAGRLKRHEGQSTERSPSPSRGRRQRVSSSRRSASASPSPDIPSEASGGTRCERKTLPRSATGASRATRKREQRQAIHGSNEDDATTWSPAGVDSDTNSGTISTFDEDAARLEAIGRALREEDSQAVSRQEAALRALPVRRRDGGRSPTTEKKQGGSQRTPNLAAAARPVEVL